MQGLGIIVGRIFFGDSHKHLFFCVNWGVSFSDGSWSDNSDCLFMMQKLILAFLIFLSPVFVKGQETVVYDPSVKTVVFQDNSASNRAMPVFPLLVLGESKKIRISFDDLSAEYHRFT